METSLREHPHNTQSKGKHNSAQKSPLNLFTSNRGGLPNQWEVQIQTASFYCNFYPSRISPSLQVRATETLIPIQMNLQGSSSIRKKVSLNTPKQQLSCHQCAFTRWGGRGLWASPGPSLVRRQKCDPSFPPLPCSHSPQQL